MARKKSPTLTEGEQRLMEVIWKRGSATVAEVLDALPKRDRPAFNTVQTMIRIMEQKGYLRHEESGRAFVYYPKVARVDAARAAVKNVLSRFFNNSAELLTVRLLEDEQLSDEELRRLRRLIDEADSR
ncbi:MAG TPA: BlaI/MecI/CopY family transcriptional regulator [Candidatus Baltobacteraceae bacterium]|nr:BlaI/MecI/CopY family transcriptional regulator [Candidatus Baltobacteraceae bacterium]